MTDHEVHVYKVLFARHNERHWREFTVLWDERRAAFNVIITDLADGLSWCLTVEDARNFAAALQRKLEEIDLEALPPGRDEWPPSSIPTRLDHQSPCWPPDVDVDLADYVARNEAARLDAEILSDDINPLSPPAPTEHFPAPGPLGGSWFEVGDPPPNMPPWLSEDKDD